MAGKLVKRARENLGGKRDKAPMPKGNDRIPKGKGPAIAIVIAPVKKGMSRGR